MKRFFKIIIVIAVMLITIDTNKYEEFSHDQKGYSAYNYFAYGGVAGDFLIFLDKDQQTVMFNLKTGEKEIAKHSIWILK